MGTDLNVPFFELWPHAIAKQNFLTLYQDRGSDFTLPTDALPTQIPDEVLNYRARYHAYEWAEANKGTNVALMQSDWMALRVIADRDYQKAFGKASKADDEAFLQLWPEMFEDVPLLGPLDSAWLQSHASPWG